MDTMYINIVCLSLMLACTLANSEDTHEMPDIAVFHQWVFNVSQKYPCMGYQAPGYEYNRTCALNFVYGKLIFII